MVRMLRAGAARGSEKVLQLCLLSQSHGGNAPPAGMRVVRRRLTTIDGNPQTYVKYGKWFYPADLPLEAVRQLADGGPVTKELVVALNPKRNEWEEIKAGLDKIGYPNEL